MSGQKTITTLPAFSPPAYPIVDDELTPQQLSSWSGLISSFMKTEITAKNPDGSDLKGPDGISRTALAQFFNGTVTPYDVSQPPAAVTWIGFPGIIAKRFPNNRWAKAEHDRTVMDEYLEWTTMTDDNDNILYAVFTCEGPEYWQFLADSDPDKLLALYKSLNPEFASQIQKADLYDGQGNYQPYNKWNGVVPAGTGFQTTNPGCIVHLAQVNNTLSAEIDIAAQATVLRKDKTGRPVTDKTQLCNCSQYGNATRNSDPQIGVSINNLAQQGNLVSVANPVALYMMDFNTSNLMLDVDGTGEDPQPVPAGTFTWVRGDVNQNMGLRLRVQIPDGVKGTGSNAGRQLTVSDIIDTSNSKNIQYAGQLADYITMGVNGVIATGKRADMEFCPQPSLRHPHPSPSHTLAMAAPGAPAGTHSMFKTRA